MKTLIIYVTKTGTTEKCANLLAEKLPNCEIVNIKNLAEKDFNSYDTLIIGSPIQMGLIDKQIKQFLVANHDLLLKKPTAYFICCGFTKDVNRYFQENYPADLLTKAIIYDTFGGELNLEKLKGFSKLIVKMVMKSQPNTAEVKILPENIDRFAQKIREK